MVIINPGNPTGQCLSEANLKEVLKFCYENNLVLLGDEVYQQNIYQDERPFISARKVYIQCMLCSKCPVNFLGWHNVPSKFRVHVWYTVFDHTGSTTVKILTSFSFLIPSVSD